MAPRLSSASLDFMGRITLGESVGLSGGSLLDCWSLIGVYSVPFLRTDFLFDSHFHSYSSAFFGGILLTTLTIYVVCDDQQHPSSSQADFVPFLSFVPHKHSPNSSLCVNKEMFSSV